MSDVSYRLMNQQFIEDQLVMKIRTDDVNAAIEEIKEEYEGKTVTHVEGLGFDDTDIHIIKIS